jgi:uncharacterized protein (TIGR03435 family)
MMLPALWNDADLQTLPIAFFNHLWQSTLVVGIAGLLTLALKKNHARARYWVWMIASAKFLIPFSLFIIAGEWIRSLVAAPIEKPGLAAAMEQITQPFQQVQLFDSVGPVVATTHHSTVLPAALLVIWASGALVFAARWASGWRRIRAAVRAATPLAFEADVPVRSTASLLEPGIFGIFRPVLLLPEGIMDRLTPEQLNAVVAHEMCHVRRRDNLTYALHMAVEVVFWFYPLVRWIGTRLLEEREQACDEAVIEEGREAQVYAEGILNVCKFYVESPAACAAGVTGSDLKKRIVRIMSEHIVHGLDVRRKVLLGVAGALAVAVPLALGLVHAGAVIAETRAEDELANLPKFDVASIKPHKDEPNGMMRIGFGVTPDGARADGVPLQMIVTQAFGVSRDRILNEPDWVKSTRYDMEAKVSPEDAPKLKGLTQRQRGVMLLPVLEDRFGLKFHHETRELNVYTLVVAKGGPKLKTAQPDQAEDGPPGGNGDRGPMTARPDHGGPPLGGKPGDGGPMPAPRAGQSFMRMSPQGMTLEGRSVPIGTMVEFLSRELGATVIDKTGLADKYDYTLNFISENRGFGFGPPPPPPPSAPSDGPAPSGSPESAPADTPPSLVDAVQQQLGLKLVQQKEPVDVIVIDHIEQPSAN